MIAQESPDPDQDLQADIELFPHTLASHAVERMEHFLLLHTQLRTVVTSTHSSHLEF